MPQVVVILAPTGRDGAVIRTTLEEAGLAAVESRCVAELLDIVASDRAGAAVIAAEAISAAECDDIRAWLAQQPPWSDLPVILLSKRSANGSVSPDLVDCLGNVTVLDRPLQRVSLISAARAALRTRARQRDAANHMAEVALREAELQRERARLERSEADLRLAHETLGQRFAEALAEKRVLADIVEGTDAFVQVADLEFRWLAINKASADEFERIFGTRPTVGSSMLDVLDHLPEHREAVRQTWSRALSGEEFTEVGEFGDAGRDRRFYEMKFNTLRDDSGERIGAYQFVYDVTDRVREQQQLAEVQAQMHEMAKIETLGQLTGGVAHDFNNLLTPIVGALDVLHRRMADDERSMKLVTGALEASERARLLVQRLLTFARRQDLKARPVDVGELVDGMHELIERTIGPQIEVSVRSAKNLPAAQIDPNQLELAILNLAVNASDAMPEGGKLQIEVDTKTVGEAEVDGLSSGEYVRVAVSDNGAGMDQDTIARAIEPFFTTKGVGKGTGLGLSMVHGLAAQSGGALTIASEPGHGTTAQIWLPPAGRGADGTLDDPTPQLMATRTTTILVVDDEPLVRAATAAMLRELGHQVVEAATASAALDLVRRDDKIEVILSDYLMPGMRGNELIKQAKVVRPTLLSILMTGYAKMTAEEPGVVRLLKPFRTPDLAQALSALLKDERA